MNQSPDSAACPFCQIAQHDNKGLIVTQDHLAFVIRDTHPISDGHSLVILKRHISSFFRTTPEERGSMLQMLDQAKQHIELNHSPDSYNIGINDGPEAGQTVPHLHMHLIPRYAGDTKDPRGGVRWLLPNKARYWNKGRRDEP